MRAIGQLLSSWLALALGEPQVVQLVGALPLWTPVLKLATLLVVSARDLLMIHALSWFRFFLILDQHLLRSGFKVAIRTCVVENYGSIGHTLTLAGVGASLLVRVVNVVGWR